MTWRSPETFSSGAFHSFSLPIPIQRQTASATGSWFNCSWLAFEWSPTFEQKTRSRITKANKTPSTFREFTRACAFEISSFRVGILLKELEIDGQKRQDKLWPTLLS